MGAILLFAMTGVCVIGAWRTPQQLNIPADSTVYAYREINRDGCTPRPAALTESAGGGSDSAARAAELRQTVPQESYAVGDTVYDCVLSIRPDPFYETKIRLFRLDGRVHSYVDALNGRFYRILDPEPLLVFFENEIAFKSDKTLALRRGDFFNGLFNFFASFRDRIAANRPLY